MPHNSCRRAFHERLDTEDEIDAVLNISPDASLGMTLDMTLDMALDINHRPSPFARNVHRARDGSLQRFRTTPAYLSVTDVLTSLMP